MEFGLRKCGVVTLKRGKIARCEGVELPDGEVMKEVEQEGYTYLGMVELDKIKEKHFHRISCNFRTIQPLRQARFSYLSSHCSYKEIFSF